MFNNIGKTIKWMAKAICVLGSIGAVVGCCVCCGAGSVGLGCGILFGGIILAWMITILMYGFGHLIENSDIIAEQSNRENIKAHKAENKQKQAEYQRKIDRIKAERKSRKFVESEEENDFCESKVSVDENDFFDYDCPNCGKTISIHKDTPANSTEIDCPNCGKMIDTSIFM